MGIQLCLSFSSQWAHLAQHVGSEQVVLILQDMYGGDGWLLMEAARLPALIPAATLPQVDAEDLPWSASIKQHRDLGTKGGVLMSSSFFYLWRYLSYFQLNSDCSDKFKQWTHPLGKLLCQDIAASAVRLCSARLGIFHYHSTREACQHIQEVINANLNPEVDNDWCFLQVDFKKQQKILWFDFQQLFLDHKRDSTTVN